MQQRNYKKMASPAKGRYHGSLLDPPLTCILQVHVFLSPQLGPKCNLSIKPGESLKVRLHY